MFLLRALVRLLKQPEEAPPPASCIRLENDNSIYFHVLRSVLEAEGVPHVTMDEDDLSGSKVVVKGKERMEVEEGTTLKGLMASIRYVLASSEKRPALQAALVDEQVEEAHLFLLPFRFVDGEDEFGLKWTEEQRAERVAWLQTEHIPRRMALMETMLDKCAFLCGDNFTAADHCWGTILWWLETSKEYTLEWEGIPNCRAYYEGASPYHPEDEQVPVIDAEEADD